jgi:hypothetical protein
MKFISLFLVVLALYLSWNMFSGKGVVVPESVHSQIQTNLSKEIVEIVARTNSKAFNIEILDFWTEAYDEKTIEAHFKFGFDEESDAGESSVVKKGRVLLKKTKVSDDAQYWDAEEVFLEGQRIEFKEGLRFPDDSPEELDAES